MARPATEIQGGIARTHTLIGPKHSHSQLVTGGVINVSQSKVKSWRTCHAQFDYKFNQHLQKKKVKRPFTFGGIAHKMLEADAEGDDMMEVLDQLEIEKGEYFRREIEMYGEIIDDLRIIMTEYLLYWKDSGLQYIRKNKRSSEHEFRVELEPGLWATGRIDGIARSKKLKWLVEHKTFSRTPNEDERWRSIQAAIYFRVLEMIGWTKFDGVLWNYISSKPPGVPEFLKSGALSQRKLNTLPTKLEQFFQQQLVGPDEREKLLAEAVDNRSNYFFRVYSLVKKPVVDIVWRDFLDTAREIAEFYTKRKDKNIGRHCSWCDYEPLCRAELQGSDVDFVKAREYVIEGEDDEDDEED